ncbi:MAG: fluoride efflux transporter FluC [Acidimicrobiales bacterium]
MHPRSAAAVAVGGALGAGLRWGLLELFESSSASWPWGVFLANVAGCAALGFIVGGPAAIVDGHTLVGLTAGFCGGLTTFSGFAFDAALMLRADDWWLLTGYLAASLGLGIGVFVASRQLARTMMNETAR